MSRTVSATISAATGETTTRPIHLVYMAWDLASPDVNRYIACWASDREWNSITWRASGARVERISPNGGQLRLPNGTDDPWLALVGTQYAVGRAVQVWEYQTDFTSSPQASDAVQVFDGVMDEVEIDDRGISITLIEGLQSKVWPPTVITRAEYPHLLTDRDRMYWGPDVVLVQ